MRCTRYFFVSLFLAAIAIFIISCKANNPKEILFNENFIYNLHNPDSQKSYAVFYTTPNLSDSEEVFEFIFSHLDDEVFVYPSENYYYFEFPADRKRIAGNIALPVRIRDEGRVSFAYFDKSRVRNPDNSSSEIREYSAKDGVVVRKINDFKYTVAFKNKTVVFKLNDAGIEHPKKAKLTEDEVFIGGSFDESGIKFFLIYNNATNNFYWILDEDGVVPERFTKISEDILIGERTEFAFYNDKENSRKILFGVKLSNTFGNTWYDGPFDQLPDNYIKIDKINITKYLVMVYPGIDNYINKYGYFSDKPGVRVSINPYYDYIDESELAKVASRCKDASKSTSEFYACITDQIVSPEYKSI